MFGQRGAAQVDPSLVGSGGVMMNRAGDQFLAGSTLARDQNGGRRSRHALHHDHQTLHRLARDDGGHPEKDRVVWLNLFVHWISFYFARKEVYRRSAEHLSTPQKLPRRL